MDVACWIDGRVPTLAQIPGWARSIRQAGIRRALIMLHGPSQPGRFRWSPGKLAEACAALRGEGVSPEWTLWGFSRRKVIDEQVWALAELVKKSRPDRIEVDAEGPWGAAGVNLAVELADELVGLGFTKFAVTAIPWIRGIREQDFALIDALRKYGPVEGRPQTYSQYQPQKAWTHRDFFRPGPIQQHGLEQWCHLLRTEQLTAVRAGLMTGFQTHPGGPRGVAAIRAAVEATAGFPIEGFSFWSWKLTKNKPDVIRYLHSLADGSALPCDPNEMRIHHDHLKTALRLKGYTPDSIHAKGVGPRTRYALEAYRKDASFAPAEWADPQIETLAEALGL